MVETRNLLLPYPNESKTTKMPWSWNPANLDVNCQHLKWYHVALQEDLPQYQLWWYHARLQSFQLHPTSHQTYEVPNIDEWKTMHHLDCPKNGALASQPSAQHYPTQAHHLCIHLPVQTIWMAHRLDFLSKGSMDRNCQNHLLGWYCKTSYIADSMHVMLSGPW